MTRNRLMRNYRSLRRVWLRKCLIARKHNRVCDLPLIQAAMVKARRQIAI